MDRGETPLGRITQSEMMLWTKMANPETVNVERLFGTGSGEAPQPALQPPALQPPSRIVDARGDANPALDDDDDSLRHGRRAGHSGYAGHAGYADDGGRIGVQRDHGDRGGVRRDHGGRSGVQRDHGGRSGVQRDHGGRSGVQRDHGDHGDRSGVRRDRDVHRPEVYGRSRARDGRDATIMESRASPRSVIRSAVRSAVRSVARAAPSYASRRGDHMDDRDRDMQRNRDRDQDRDRDRDRDRDGSADRGRTGSARYARTDRHADGHDGPPSSYEGRPSKRARPDAATSGRERAAATSGMDRERDKHWADSQVKRARRSSDCGPAPSPRARPTSPGARAPVSSSAARARAPPAPADDASSQFSAKRRHVEEQKLDLLDQLDELRVMHGLGKVRDGKHREYGVQDDIRSIRFQVERLLRLKDQKENCEFMHDGIKIGCYVIETAVSKLGFDALDGWADTVDGQKKRLRPILAKLYHRWFKRGGFSNPYLELALALGGSAFICATSKGNRKQAAPAHSGRASSSSYAPQHRDANNADGREFSFDDFQSPAPGAPNAARQGALEPAAAVGGGANDDDDDDDMPGPQDAGIGGGAFSALMGGAGGAPGIMGMMGSMMGMRS